MPKTRAGHPLPWQTFTSHTAPRQHVFPGGCAVARGTLAAITKRTTKQNKAPAFLRETKSPCSRWGECGVKSQVLGWKSSEDQGQKREERERPGDPEPRLSPRSASSQARAGARDVTAGRKEPRKRKPRGASQP